MIEFLNSKAEVLARIQFAFTISFHIIFPSFTIGLASWLAVVEYKWLTTKDKVYQSIYKMWVKIFAVCFGLGVVSGIVMSYQFGTNWAAFINKGGNIIGPLHGYEVLTAFFLEASFLGIMLFGWNKVSDKMHFVSTCIVAIGTLFSAFWILSANSWMHTPQGFGIDDKGSLYAISWFQIIFNPSFPYRLVHMVGGAYITTALVVGGVGAYYLIKNKYIKQAKVKLKMAMLLIFFAIPVQIFVGDLHGLNSLKYQPLKIAALEGIWETKRGVGLKLFAIPNQKEQKNDYQIEIPKLGSVILAHDANAEIKGLKEWDVKDHPPVAVVFFSFRVMVGIAILILVTALCAAILYFRKKLFDSKWFHRWCIFMSPMGFVAIISGWVTTEVGRQPYLVYNILRTSDGLSPVIGSQIAISLAIFIIVYSIIFGAGIYYIFKLISKGPIINDQKENYYDHSKEASFIKSIDK